jgi:NAD(P)-dependent dehydrogenase (short-subunit alcohol dehydrogenase family)
MALLFSTLAPSALSAQNLARPMADQDRRVAVITGSTSGLGRALALQLGEAGWHVVVHGRDVERGEQVVAEIARGGTGSARFLRADLGSLAEVRQFADTILQHYNRVDLLINNAGIGSRVPADRALSADGHELRFAVNYLSHFLLTYLLLPRIRTSAPARIINVSSIGQAPIDFADVMIEQDFSGSRAYGQSKLAQIMFTIDLASDLAGTNIQVFALHPATYMDTNMVRASGITPRSTVDEGANAVRNLLTASNLENGQFFNGLEPARANAQAYDAAARARLRALSFELTGLDDSLRPEVIRR